jgi:hypothetical protein
MFKTKHSSAKEAKGYEAHGGAKRPAVLTGAKFDNGSAGEFVCQSNDNGTLKLGDGQHIFVFAGESPAFLPNNQQPASDPS